MSSKNCSIGMLPWLVPLRPRTATMPLCTSFGRPPQACTEFELLRFADLKTGFFVPEIGLDSEPWLLRVETTFGGELLLVIGDGKHRSLHGSNHVGKRAGKVLDQDPEEAVRWNPWAPGES